MKKIILALMIIFLMSNTVRVFAQPEADPAGDCLNLAGKAAPCEPYMDIVSSDVSMSLGAYTGIITFAGNVPTVGNSSSTYIEWDIAIDADRNPKTNPWCGGTPGTEGACSIALNNLLVNGIGVEYLVRYWVQGLSSGAQIYSNSSNNYDISSYQVNGNRIQLSWLPADIGGSKFFDYVILARVYEKNTLLILDKAPNVGHYEFQAGNQTSTITTTLTNLTGQMGMGDFTLSIVDRNDLTGKNLTLSDFRGKVIALEFMGPWCPACQQLVPFMESLYNYYTNKGVVFITVAVPWKPSDSHYQNVTITQFLNKYNSSLTYVDDLGFVANDMYNIQWLPTLFVLSKTGAIGETYGRLEGVDPIEHRASGAIDAMLAQVVVTITSQTSTLSSSQSLQPSQTLTTGVVQTASQNPIPGFSIDSIVLGLMVGFALLLIARRAAFKRKSTS